MKTFTIPMHDVYRAMLDSEEADFVKIHVREGADRILGVTIVARHAGEMIYEITLAMLAGIGLRTLGSVIEAAVRGRSAFGDAPAPRFCASGRRTRTSDRQQARGPRDDTAAPTADPTSP